MLIVDDHPILREGVAAIIALQTDMAIVQPALERAEEVLVEGRERVTELRSRRRRDFPEELARLAANPIFPQARIAPLAITGTPRPIAPALIDDLLAVLGEALGNAAVYSQASRIEIGLRFGRWSFVTQVRDNGIGMAEGVIAEGASPGHFGLAQGNRLKVLQSTNLVIYQHLSFRRLAAQKSQHA